MQRPINEIQFKETTEFRRPSLVYEAGGENDEEILANKSLIFKIPF